MLSILLNVIQHVKDKKTFFYVLIQKKVLITFMERVIILLQYDSLPIICGDERELTLENYTIKSKN